MKRVFDIFLSCALLVLFLPIIVVVAIAVYFNIGRPIFFKQLRPGLNSKPFTIIKFRTMIDNRDISGLQKSDNERLTRFGIFLRSTSLDELPELINVIIGDMSLVGPRPLLLEYLQIYSSDQLRRHTVRPGITGLAQISGRNELPWEDRFELDLWYIDNWTFFLDIKILLITIFKIIKREGISEIGSITMTNFIKKKK